MRIKKKKEKKEATQRRCRMRPSQQRIIINHVNSTTGVCIVIFLLVSPSGVFAIIMVSSPSRKLGETKVSTVGSPSPPHPFFYHLCKNGSPKLPQMVGYFLMSSAHNR